MTPRAQGITRPSDERLVRRLAVAPGGELHVDGGRLRVSLALASGQQLLERMGQQLIGGHVLATPEELARRDLVEDGRHLVVAQQPVTVQRQLRDVDPQQLEQPKMGSHPEGVNDSALQHMLGEHLTMPADRGVFLPVTWRLAPSICAFTSELFYEARLTSKAGLDTQQLTGGPFTGNGLWVVEVDHYGNRNASDEEVETVADLVGKLTAPGSQWIDEHGVAKQMTGDQILVVAPYNAQVSRLATRVNARVGTVDRFQGQQAPVVIYSMATSHPEEAPRGLEFLYSLNRLNVATSRAQCAVILVASPHLFEPNCSTPRQMKLANALCRYRELARVLVLGESRATG